MLCRVEFVFWCQQTLFQYPSTGVDHLCIYFSFLFCWGKYSETFSPTGSTQYNVTSNFFLIFSATLCPLIDHPSPILPQPTWPIHHYLSLPDLFITTSAYLTCPSLPQPTWPVCPSLPQPTWPVKHYLSRPDYLTTSLPDWSLLTTVYFDFDSSVTKLALLSSHPSVFICLASGHSKPFSEDYVLQLKFLPLPCLMRMT